MSKAPVALVAGVGPGLGVALVEKFASEGFRVAAVARNLEKLEALLGERGLAEKEKAYSCDVSDPQAVEALFGTVESELGAPSLVAYNAGAFIIGSITELDPDDVARCWQIGCFGGFLVGQAAARGMLAAEIGGTMLFTGATAGLRGSARFAPFAMTKFGLRALAQSMARELGPKGIHVAHIIIDGGIGEFTGSLSAEVDAPDKTLSPDAIAETYWQVHKQHRSTWTQELDLRPWVETF
ncbi:MAG: SDR family NAD(P)-dependent oxidoreductase [Hyphomicrobiales bacterium]|nr:SDR family NAD(P)-dependent oxidoreductase [Hyphomicrobiales bacterium]